MNRIAQLVTAIALLQTTPAFAASADAHQQPVAGSGLFIAFAIAYLSRRRAVGGWLLYFYLQMYLSLLISLLFVPQVISNLRPSNWDNALLYVMFFLSVVPVLAAELVEVFAATRLLFRRSEANLNFLRWTLVTLVVATVASIALDLVYFKDDPGIVFDFITAFSSAIWAIYFRKARRVKAVFVDKSWNYDSQSVKRILTAEDKKKLRKRALIAASVTFVLLLILMGSALKEKAPDAGIFFVPIFYAFIAAIIAWYLPVKRKDDTSASAAVAPSGKDT
jgi:hypothetical protein